MTKRHLIYMKRCLIISYLLAVYKSHLILKKLVCSSHCHSQCVWLDFENSLLLLARGLWACLYSLFLCVWAGKHKNPTNHFTFLPLLFNVASLHSMVLNFFLDKGKNVPVFILLEGYGHTLYHTKTNAMKQAYTDMTTP
jgi:hypothetical protein